MIDINNKSVNERLADIRSEADASYKASKNLREDAARLYAAADKLYAANSLRKYVYDRLMKNGALEPDVIEGILDGAFGDFERMDLFK